MPALAEVAREKLHALERGSRRRVLAESGREEGVEITQGGKRYISFSCNDYLGMSRHPKVRAAAAEAALRWGSGAGASRLVTGNHPLYGALETKLASWKGAEAACIFGSGYLANIGIIPAIAGRDDLIIADKLVHACLIDGALLSGAKLLRFKHNNAADAARILQEQRGNFRHCLIVTEEVFSMDGDLAPLEALAALAKEHDAWLMADGAHSISPAHAPVDIYVGTLSKALGSYGGYACGTRELIQYLHSAARSLLFSTALPPAAIAAADAVLDIISADAGLPATALAKAQLFTQALGLPEAQSPIVPLILGTEETAIAAAEALKEAGFLAVAIRPPTVPEGTSRLRFTFSALHRDEDILGLAAFIKSKGWL